MKNPKLRTGEKALLRRISEWPGLRTGGLFTLSSLGEAGPYASLDLAGLLSLGLVMRRTYRGGSCKLFLSPLGQEVAKAIWPPDGDPCSYRRKRKGVA